MQAFVAGITVHPDEMRMDVQIRIILAALVAAPGNPSVGLVAGAGSDPAI